MIMKSAKDYILKEDAHGNKITVKDIHDVLLGILKDIDAVCRKHNIPYWLNGGSALGAVRHQGFIPWDDDADIAMMREDFIRFQQVAMKELGQYAIHSFDIDSRYNVMIPGMKIRKKDTYIKEVNFLLPNNIKECNGLFVDVFVYDYVSENKAIDVLNRLKAYCYTPFIEVGELMGKNPKWVKKAFMNHARNYGKRNTNSKYIGFDITWLYKNPLKPFVFKYEDIFPVQYVPFEDTQLPIAHHPHEYLCTAIAPSYMTIPSEDKQIPKHTADIRL